MSSENTRRYLVEMLPQLAELADACVDDDLGEAAFTLRLLVAKIDRDPGFGRAGVRGAGHRGHH